MDIWLSVHMSLCVDRCDCNGHAETCDTFVRPYECQCAPDSFTQGIQCSSCLPMYNDKPFRVGDQINAYNCKPCNCYEHANRCVYNSTIDPFPNDHNRYVPSLSFYYIHSARPSAVKFEYNQSNLSNVCHFQYCSIVAKFKNPQDSVGYV